MKNVSPIDICEYTGEPDPLRRTPAIQAGVISLASHAILFAFIATFWVSISQQVDGQSLSTRWTEQTEAVTPVEEMPTVDLSISISPNQAGSSMAKHVSKPSSDVSDPHISISKPLPVKFFAEEFTTDQLAASVELSLTDLDSLKHLARLGQGTGDEAGNNAGGGFFSKAPPGKRFVYVVDASGSMNHPHDSESGTRFGRVKVELLRAIHGLATDQEFYVVFFNDNALPMPSRRMQVRSTNSLDRYFKWIAGFRADGMTDPREALMIALRLQPDVIYFLTDGRIRKSDADDIIEANQRRVQINTVCIGEAESEGLMKNLATANRGKYQFVP